jgi:hypothetical protein
MTHTDLLARDALAEAYASLSHAAGELTVVVLAAPPAGPFGYDAYVLAEAVEARVEAVLVTLARDG